MPDPITDWESSDTGAILKDKTNQNFAQRHWRDVVDIDDGDSPYAVADGDELIRVDASADPVTVTLPDVADNANRVIWVEAVDVTETVTLDGDGADINGAGTKTIGTAGRLVSLFSDGVEWTAHYSDRLA
jgi:hypothetical protein